MRLGIKFGFVSTFVIILLIGSVILLVSVDVEDALRRENHEKLTAVGEALAEELVNPLLNGNVLTVKEIIEGYKERGGYIEDIFVIDFEGRVAAHTFEGGFPMALLDANPIPPQKMHSIQTLSTEEGILDDGAFRILEGTEAEVHLIANEKSLKSAVAATNRRIAAVGFLFLLLGGAVVFLLSYRITRPMEKIVGGMETIGGGKLGYRIEVNTKDELGGLAAAFNKMVGDLEESKRQIEEKTGTLEKEVAERKRAEEELKQRLEEIERMNRLMVGRELRMVELKGRIKELEAGAEGLERKKGKGS